MGEYCTKVGGANNVTHDADDDGRPACLMGKITEYRYKPAEEPEDEEYCNYCAGTVKQHGNVGSARAKKLEATSPEQLGLSPIGDRP